MRAPAAALLLLTAVSSACATGSEMWLIPQVMIQPGSPVVVISNSKLRSVEPSGGSGWFGGGTTNRGMNISTVAWSFQTLDVRTCKLGALHRFTKSVEAVGWGSAPGELWVRGPDNAPTIRLLEGSDRLETVDDFAVDVRTGKAAPLGAGSTGADLVGAAVYSVDPEHRQVLMAVDPSSGRRWTAATDAEGIRSVVGVPAARKVVIVDERQRILTFDVDTRQLRVCQ